MEQQQGCVLDTPSRARGCLYGCDGKISSARGYKISSFPGTNADVTAIHGALIDLVQVIVARMGITFILSSAYMWWTKVPDFPLGARSVRGWLILRAAFGFGGLYCLYCKSQNTGSTCHCISDTHARLQIPFITCHLRKQRYSGS
jgi:hypothetical protein